MPMPVKPLLAPALGPKKSSPGQVIADAVERYWQARDRSQFPTLIVEAKAALAREIDAALKATAASVYLDDLV